MRADYHQTVINFNTHRGFHQTVNFCLNAGMDTKAEIRRQRLAKIIEDRFDGNQTVFADVVGKRQSAISDMLREKKSFGEKVARDIERKLGLPDLWLDGEDVARTETGESRSVYVNASSPEDLVNQLKAKGEHEMLEILKLLVANTDKLNN